MRLAVLRDVCIGLGAGWALLLGSEAAADDRGRRGEAFYVVTAESRYGSETISAPVRRVAYNRSEVRLPGGSWVDCHRSCSETLRRETIDFWQNHGGSMSGGIDGPGYFLFRR